MVYFTSGVKDGVFTKDRYLLRYIISMPVYHTQMYFTSTETVDCIIYLLLVFKEQIYKNILLISECLISINLGGDKADGYRSKCSLPPANDFLYQLLPVVHHLLVLRM